MPAGGLVRVVAPSCAVLVTVLLACCSRPAALWYSPPAQRHPADVLALPWSTIVNTDDPGADFHFVKDIEASSGASWRWTRQEPTIKILLPAVDAVKLVVDFSLWEGTFRFTGPVDVAFSVNGRLLERRHFDSPGLKHFEKPVPPEWLSLQSDTTASAHIDPIYTDKETGAQYGFILTRIGFARL